MTYPESKIGEHFRIVKGISYKGAELVSDSDVGLLTIDAFLPGGGYKHGSPKPYAGSYNEKEVANPSEVLLAMTEQQSGLLASPLLVPEMRDGFQTLIYSLDVVKVIPTSNQVVPEFLFNFLRVPLNRRRAAYGDTGSTVQRLPYEALYEQKMFTPPTSQQHAINKFVRSLDEKIRLNTEISKTLEAIARTIFQSWFIDFDPVHAKMRGEKPEGMDDATAALFPDSFEESELGLIPKGWEVRSLAQFAKTAIGGLWGKDDEEVDSPNSYFCIRGVDMDDLSLQGFAPRCPTRWAKQVGIDKRLPSNCDVLIGGSGAGPVAKSILWDDSLTRTFDRQVVYSNFVKRFSCPTEEHASFLQAHLGEMYESGEIFNFVNGTSVPNLQDQDLLMGKSVAVPSAGVLERYNSLVRNALARKYLGEIKTLAQIRDALLPRLISGELEIPDEMLAS